MGIGLSTITTRDDVTGTQVEATHEKVLQEIITVLLVSPDFGGPQDILDVLEDPLAVVTETCGSGVGSTGRLECVGIDDEFEEFGKLLLRSAPGQLSAGRGNGRENVDIRELASREGTASFGDLDSLALGREVVLDLPTGREGTVDGAGQEGRSFRHGERID